MSNIHQTAIVSPSAKIHESVIIGAYSIIGENVKIQQNTIIHPHVVIQGDTTIGEDNEIFSFAVLGTDPQDLKYNGEKTQLIIGNKNKIREHTLINTGTVTGINKTVIGNNNLIMGHVHIGHDCEIQNNVVIANSTAIAGHVQIDSNAVIGGQSAIHQFCKIGELAMVGGGSIVVQDIPPFCLCEGNRATLRGLNINGLRRKFEDKEKIDKIKSAYKKLFKQKLPIKDQVKTLINSEIQEVKKLALFVQNTKRGIPK